MTHNLEFLLQVMYALSDHVTNPYSIKSPVTCEKYTFNSDSYLSPITFTLFLQSRIYNLRMMVPTSHRQWLCK